MAGQHHLPLFPSSAAKLGGQIGLNFTQQFLKELWMTYLIKAFF
jgi:hypothetical protein